ncbi:MAG: glucokinase, partial [Anaerolineae bacterium]
MLLAGDIGGTKTNLALFESAGKLEPQVEITYRSSDYPNLKAVVADFLSETKASVDRAVFGVAGPVVGGKSTTTNLPWVISEDTLRESMGVERVKLLNDLEATAHGVLHLQEDDLYTLNDVLPC